MQLSSVLPFRNESRSTTVRFVPHPYPLKYFPYLDAVERYVYCILFGGASRDRTDGLVVANDALSQLSYSPTMAGTDYFRIILTAFPEDTKLHCDECR